MNPNPIVIACSGPSLNRVNLWSTTAPIAAISTAIQYPQMKPKFWFLIDSWKQNKTYGDDFGRKYAEDPTILKVIRNGGWVQRATSWCKPLVIVETTQVNDPLPAGRWFMDGNPVLLRAAHKSILFAVQWLIQQGFNQLIFAGVDLKSTAGKPRIIGREMTPANVKIYNEGHDQVLTCLEEWSVFARNHDIEFLSWTPGSPINLFMPFYDPSAAASSSPTPLLHDRVAGLHSV